LIELDTTGVITTFYSGALATNGGEFGKASLAIWFFEQRVLYVDGEAHLESHLNLY